MTGPQGEGEEDTKQHELVIIRRRGGGEEEAHHGGVWKIAHADFMTALMAFFLVMWLINATDEKTISGIANYFNPMRLTDQTAQPKGIFTMEPGGEHNGSERGMPEPDKKSGPRKTSEKNAEAALFSDPYEALDKIAAQAGKTQPEPAAATGHKAGEAFRDPFDPDMRPDMPSEAAGQGGEKEGATAPGDKGAGGSEKPAPQQPEVTSEEEKRASEELRRQIEETVKKSGFAAIPGIDVRATKEGLLISITDQPNFEMFNIASARPQPELVVLMEKIGKIIAGRPEHVVVRGHTDGRPFRSDNYDNWRLSTARAHMAYYMLVRSGIPEARIDRIEGHADHDLKIADRPLAAENRRIEVLLLQGGP